MSQDLDDAIFAAERYGDPIPGARAEPRPDGPTVLVLHTAGIPDSDVRARVPSWEPSSYLVDYDPDKGLESLVVSRDLADARRFDGMLEAMDLWQTVDPHTPVRPDGKPNRPLTAFTVEPRRLAD